MIFLNNLRVEYKSLRIFYVTVRRCYEEVGLLAPAGMLEKLKMAIMYGADAVYLAGEVFRT